MGYTHYYSHKKEIAQENWDKFLADVKKVANTFNLCNPQSIDFIKDGDGFCGNIDSAIKIGSGDGEGDTPTFTNQEICFNGVGDQAHETLYIKRDDVDGQFCKTARKEYDTMCAATLVLYKHHFGDNVSIGSDGGTEGFQEGKELVKVCCEGIELDDSKLFGDEEE